MDFNLTYWDEDGNTFDYNISENEAIMAIAKLFAKDKEENFEVINATISNLYEMGALDLEFLVNKHTKYLTEYFKEAAFSI